MLSKRVRWLGLGVLALVAFALVACEPAEEDPPAAPPPAETPTPVPGNDDATPTPTPDPLDPEPANGLFEEDAAETISMTMDDLFFDPDDVTIQSGEVVEFQLTNDGVMLHDFTIDEIDAEVDARDGASVTDHEADVHVEVQTGQTGEMRLRVNAPGEYEFYCSVPGHREGGMVGTLIVE